MGSHSQQDRTLTDAQHERLDILGEQDERARVVGWIGYGPVIRRDSGVYQAINRFGKLVEVALQNSPLAHAIRRRLEERGEA